MESITAGSRQVIRVLTAIDDLGHRCLRDVKCECDGNTIVLQGVVRSFYFKQIIQTAAAKVVGVANLKNEIIVVEDYV